MEKKALFIVGDFWPTKGGGVIRVEKLIKYLPEFNWKGIVLTRKIDSTIAEEQIDGISIYRTETYNLANLYHKLKSVFASKKTKNSSNENQASDSSTATKSNERLADLFFVPDIDVFWAIGSVRKLSKIVKKEKIDVIYSSSPSASVHIAALIYRKFFNRSIRWIVEFRDPWTSNPFRRKKFFLLEKIDQYLEKLVIYSCDEINVVSITFVDEFSTKYPEIPIDKLNYIPNGFDPEDFDSLTKIKKTGFPIEIIHAGNFYGRRSVKPFLEAMKIFHEEYPQYQNRLRFTQYGAVDPDGIAFNDLYPNPMVNFKSTISHRESLQEMSNANWLLLIPGPGAGTMTGKLYEYIATGNPIIALLDDGAAKQLIDTLGIGFTIPINESLSLVEILLKIVEGKANFGEISIENPALKKFDRKHIALEVSRLLNRSYFNFIAKNEDIKPTD